MFLSRVIYALLLAGVPVVLRAEPPPAQLRDSERATGTLRGAITFVNDAGVIQKFDHAVVYEVLNAQPPPTEKIDIVQQRVGGFMHFVPDFLVVVKGTTARFTNPLGEPHEVHTYNDANAFESTRFSLTPVTYEHVFSELGTSLLACHLHGTMVGWVLTVKGASTPVVGRQFEWKEQGCGVKHFRAWAGLISPPWASYGELDFFADPCAAQPIALTVPVQRTFRIKRHYGPGTIID